jgi:hypothetical protein
LQECLWYILLNMNEKENEKNEIRNKDFGQTYDEVRTYADEVLSKFSPEFREKINSSAIYNRVFYMLLSGVSSAKIIEDLLKIIENGRTTTP